MNVRKFFLTVITVLLCVNAGFSRTYEEVEKEFYQLYNGLDSMQKSSITPMMNLINTFTDKEMKKMVMENAIAGLKPTVKANQDKKTPPKATEVTKEKNDSRIARLKNPKTKIDEIKDIISTHVFKGSGTYDDPVQISTTWELLAIAQAYSSRDDRYDSIKLSGAAKNMPVNLSFKLMSDLDFGADGLTWDVVFDYRTIMEIECFSAVFDGNYHSIKNIKASVPLFKGITLNGVVKNLKIENGTFNINGDNFEHPGPFCDNLDGALINCSFDGVVTSNKPVYLLGYSKNNTGIAVGCMAVNKSRSAKLSKNVTLSGCTSSISDSASGLNNSVATWNALYEGNDKYSCEGHFVKKSNSLSLEKGKPDAVRIRSARLRNSDAIFKNVSSVIVDKPSLFSDNNVRLVGKNIPNGTSITMWNSGTRVALEPAGREVNLHGKYYPAYTLMVYTKLSDGSYETRTLDADNAYVADAFDDGTRKGLHICYKYGSEHLFLLTDAAEESRKKFFYDKDRNADYGLVIPYSSWIELPNERTVKRIIRGGSW